MDTPLAGVRWRKWLCRSNSQHMSQFEFISVAVSLVFALGLGRLLTALPHAVEAGRRDWLHLCHLLVLFLFFFQTWWRTWSFSEIDTWNPGSMMLLASPAIFMYISASAMATDAPREVTSWSEQLRTRGGFAYAAMLCAMIAVLMRNYVLAGLLPGAPGLIAMAPLLVGAFRPSRSVQKVTVLVCAIALMFVIIRFWSVGVATEQVVATGALTGAPV